MPARDTVRLRRKDADDGSETTRLDAPKRRGRRERLSTVIDLRGGERPRGRSSTVLDLLGGKRRERREERTQLDLGLTMATDLRSGAERDETPAPAPKRRRRLLIGAGALAAVAALTVSLLAAYNGDARSAVGGDCVHHADAAATGGWKTQPCALPAVFGERYQVLLRIEGTADAGACAEHLPSWGAEGDREALVGTDARPAVLCVVPAN